MTETKRKGGAREIMHMHYRVERNIGIHACTVTGCHDVGIKKEKTIGGGGDIEQDVPNIKILEPLTMALHLAQMCEDLDYYKRMRRDVDNISALYESREGVRSDLGL